jgi:hypothetical protein
MLRNGLLFVTSLGFVLIGIPTAKADLCFRYAVAAERS